MKNFITKFKTQNFKIGSFDVNIEKSKELIRKNNNLEEKQAKNILSSMPTTHRASIIDNNDNYIGYIGIYDIDGKNDSCKIRFETNRNLNYEERKEILETYKEYLENLNLINYKEINYTSNETKTKETNPVEEKIVSINSNHLFSGISEETLKYFSSQYNIPNLNFPFTIKDGEKLIGIIGITNLIWSNKRATIQLFIDKKYDEEYLVSFTGYIINEYLEYLHAYNLYNISMQADGSDKLKNNIINTSDMKMFAALPFASEKDEMINSLFMYQHFPDITNEYEIKEKNISVPVDYFDTEKKEINDVILLENGYKLVNSKAFEKEKIDINKLINSHAKCLRYKEQFSVPLGEYKLFPQIGNGNYGISKAIKNYTYILVNKENDYSGYINILHENLKNKNVEIEIGIEPSLQGHGLGTKVLEAFYEELFSAGYSSISSVVFSFNEKSLKLHKALAQYNGARKESYYINGKLWDMDYFTKVNPKIEKR